MEVLTAYYTLRICITVFFKFVNQECIGFIICVELSFIIDYKFILYIIIFYLYL